MNRFFAYILGHTALNSKIKTLETNVNDLIEQKKYWDRKEKAYLSVIENQKGTIELLQDCIKKVFMCNPRWHEICAQTIREPIKESVGVKDDNNA